MLRTLARLLTLSLVPVLIFTNSTTAEAANLNDWHAVNVSLPGNQGPSVDCQLRVRYQEDREGVTWGDGRCDTQANISPFSAQAGEAGSDYTLTFKGVREGEVAEVAYTNSTTFNGIGVHDPSACVKVDFSTSTGLTRGSGTATIVHKNTCGVAQAEVGISVTCTNASNTTTPGPYGGLSSSGWALNPGASTSKTVTCQNGGYVSYFAVYSSATWGGTKKYDSWKITQFTGPLPPSEGAGAGLACEATKSGDLTEHPDSSTMGLVSTIPAASLEFPDVTGGACLVSQVCLEVEGTLTGIDYSAGSKCLDASWAAPAGGGTTGTEPTAPPMVTPDNEVEPVADEAAWWQRMLEMLLGLIKSIAEGFMTVVNAIGELLDWLGGLLQQLADLFVSLFVPDQAFLESKSTQLRDAWQQTPPYVFVAGVQDVGSAFVIDSPTGGCGGPELSFSNPFKAGDLTASPLSTCEPAMGNLAALIKIALTVMVYVGGFLAAVRIVGAAFGLDTTIGKGADPVS